MKIIKLNVILFLMFLTFAQLSYAIIYKQTDESGNVVYSDTPKTENAEIIQIPTQSNYKSTRTSTSSEVGISQSSKALSKEDLNKIEQGAKASADEEVMPVGKKRASYTEFKIVSPADQETLQNPVTIPVRIAVEPELQLEDKIQVLLDGQKVGQPELSTSFNVPGVERGTHSISAVIIDPRNIIIKESNKVTVFVKRTNLNSPARRVESKKSYDEIKGKSLFVKLGLSKA